MSVPIALIHPDAGWPVGVSSAVRAYLTPLLRDGPSAYLDNAQGARFEVIRVGHRAVPLVICERARGKAAMLSPTGHYLDYPIHEIARASARWTPARLAAILWPARAVLFLGRIDRVVYVNHWLLVGGPPLNLERTCMEALLGYVVRRFPNHAVVVPAVVPALAPADYDHLRSAGCRMVQSRVVHVYDPTAPRAGQANKTVRYNLRADHRTWREAEADRVEDPEALLSQTDRMAALYRALYIDKHAHLNPGYTATFFRHILTCGLFRSSGWMKDGKLAAFDVQLVHDRCIVWSGGGYDPDAPTELGLYRLVMADDVALADRAGAVLNWGAGVGGFKRFRGATPTFEFEAVYDRHLPPHRRLPWEVIRRFRDRKYGIRHPLTDLTVDPSRYR